MKKKEKNDAGINNLIHFHPVLETLAPTPKFTLYRSFILFPAPKLKNKKKKEKQKLSSTYIGTRY